MSLQRKIIELHDFHVNVEVLKTLRGEMSEGPWVYALNPDNRYGMAYQILRPGKDTDSTSNPYLKFMDVTTREKPLGNATAVAYLPKIIDYALGLAEVNEDLRKQVLGGSSSIAEKQVEALLEQHGILLMENKELKEKLADTPVDLMLLTEENKMLREKIERMETTQREIGERINDNTAVVEALYNLAVTQLRSAESEIEKYDELTNVLLDQWKRDRES